MSKLTIQDKPGKITKAFVRYLNKQMNRSILQLVETAYTNGWNDAMAQIQKVKVK